MLSKCANPACTAKLHYLHEGKIFRVDMEAEQNRNQHGQHKPVESRKPAAAAHAPGVVVGHDAAYKPEFFWLCAACAEAMTLALEDHIVVILPLPAKASEDRIAS